MNKEFYPFRRIDNDFVYFFLSEGVRGIIEKGVLIERLPEHLCLGFESNYNLGFGNVMLVNDERVVDDSVRSGNGDMAKIIATVARIAINFLRDHPECTLSFQGFIDTKSAQHGKNHRNILYQRGIESNWDELSAEFDFWGVTSGNIEAYVVGRLYDRILVKHK